ncbi:class V lanthionine synthetase subunit LxmK [Streptomyces sp. HPF1205]|uniref:class V lanthionine synthetase subunit LxmK n=1 Tax=Streptomyces sp. HPF1205 TaxID=2873262 RepID=UPI001CECE0E8|nr:class V lanthionine synthetase subunit LxmK [Streptomyces sp. HPF1205]
MDATKQAAPATRPRSRVVLAAPLDRPDEFARAVAALSGAVPVVEDVQGYVGRNDNWRVPTTAAGDLFVKRLRGDAAQVDARMSRLLAFQEAIGGGSPGELRTVRFHGADRERSLVVYDHLDGTRTGSELLADDEFEPELARRLGRVVGEIHRLPRVPVDVADSGGEKAAAAFYALTVEQYADCSGGEAEAWVMLQHDRVLIEALERLRGMSAAAPVTAAHCDLRLDQFLIDGPAVHVIDWEEFRYSDPARDVGGFAGEFLHHAALRAFATLDVAEGLAPGEAHEVIVAAGERELAAARGYIGEFWAGYREVADPDPGLPVRATGYAGWHFFDRLLAGAAHGAMLTAAERGMAGIGRNALTEPERFASIIGLHRD